MFAHKSALKRQFEKAGSLLHRLFSLKLIQIVLVFLVLLFISPIIFFLVLRPKVQREINYGTTFSNRYSEQMGLNWRESYLNILNDLGVKNIRLVAYWDEIEKNPDVYDFSNIKWQIEEAQKRNLNVILAIGRKVPRYPECFEPSWWKELPSDALREQSLLNYIKATVKEFRNFSSVKMWQVENEPFWPFGTCSKPEIKKELMIKEIELVRSMDQRPILVQDSGEGGFWRPTYELGDYLGISMYRKIWYDFWHIFAGRFIYFQYPLGYWTYKIKANLVGVPVDKIYITELQGEPWGPSINSELSQNEADKTMSRADFISTISYAQKSGFKNLYLWGAEWWYFQKLNGNSYYWDTARALFK